MKKVTLLVGLAAIDGGLRDLKGIVANVNERAQQLACSIIAHDVEHGDCSRASQLVNVLSSAEQRRFMVQFLAYFGNIGIKVEKGFATKAGHIADDSKRSRKPSIDGAKANNWFEPYDASGKKADWYEGPNPNLFVSGTLGDLGDSIIRFSKRIEENLGKTKDNGAGKDVPLYDLTDDQRKQVREALAVLTTVGNAVMANDVTERMKPFLEAGKEVATLGQKFGATTTTQTEDANQTETDDETVEVQERAVG